MSDLSLTWVMILKEFRTTFRERSQLRALAISVIMLTLIAANAMHPMLGGAARGAGHAVGEHAAHALQISPRAIWLARWIAIAGTVVVGFFFSMGYLMSAVLASFVGEKEARTLEVLLASPLSDIKLFLVKSTSVLAPSAIIGAAFTLVIATLVIMLNPLPLLHVPILDLFIGVALGLPALMLLQLCFVGLGAAISARAETMKGAAQSLGFVTMFLIFGSAYGLPLVLRSVPSLQAPLLAMEQYWLSLSFIGQYGMLILAVGAPAVILMSLGRTFFRRDRMLN